MAVRRFSAALAVRFWGFEPGFNPGGTSGSRGYSKAVLL